MFVIISKKKWMSLLESRMSTFAQVGQLSADMKEIQVRLREMEEFAINCQKRLEKKQRKMTADIHHANEHIAELRKELNKKK